VYSKAKIFNLALSALLLQRQVIDADTDPSNEAKVLLSHWDAALALTLEDLDLDSTASQAILELQVLNPNDQWSFAYKYPADCAFLRRIQSSAVIDNRTTHVPKMIRMHQGKKCIFTNQQDAIAEYISINVPLNTLSASAGLAIALRLASLAAPLITGKGAQKLIETIEAKYIKAKAEAQEKDALESHSFVDEAIESEFVEARTT